MKEKRLHYGFVIVAGTFINILVCGGIFFGASGVFIVPVTESLGIGQGQFSMYLTIQSFTMALTMLIAPKLIGKFSYRKLNTASVVIAAAGFMMMGFAQNVILLYIGGVLIGLGCVFLTYLISGTLLPRWFHQNLSTMIALAMSGLGLGGILFNPIASALISGKGLLGFNEGWRSAYIILGLMVLVICLPIAIFVLRDDPSEKGLLPYGAGSDNHQSVKRTVNGVGKAEAIRSLSFIWYVIMVVSFTLCGAIMTYLPALAANSPAVNSAGFNISSIIGSTGMFGAILGGFLIGTVNDRFGAQIGGLTAGALGCLGFILMLLGGSSAYLLLGGSVLYGIFYQINQVQMPAMVNAMYGEREYDKIFPVAAMFSPWVGAVSFSMWGFVFDMTGSYNIMLIIGLTLSIITAATGILAVSASKKLKRETAESK